MWIFYSYHGMGYHSIKANKLFKSLLPKQWTCLLIYRTYPNSVIPFINSSLVNSHCVAALNRQAMIRTVLDSGFKFKSSRNFITPSTVILSSSCGSKSSRKFIGMIATKLKKVLLLVNMKKKTSAYSLVLISAMLWHIQCCDISQLLKLWLKFKLKSSLKSIKSTKQYGE